MYREQHIVFLPFSLIKKLWQLQLLKPGFSKRTPNFEDHQLFAICLEIHLSVQGLFQGAGVAESTVM
jgi:hypothetical protein